MVHYGRLGGRSIYDTIQPVTDTDKKTALESLRQHGTMSLSDLLIKLPQIHRPVMFNVVNALIQDGSIVFDQRTHRYSVQRAHAT